MKEMPTDDASVNRDAAADSSPPNAPADSQHWSNVRVALITAAATVAAAALTAAANIVVAWLQSR